MFPFRHSSIFRSRWIALLWAGSIIWMATDFTGRPDDGGNGSQATDASGAPADQEQLHQAQQLLSDLGK